MSATSRDQMELSLDRTNQAKPAVRPMRRFNRARWWFAQMHRVVDDALDWGNQNAARPVQSDLAIGSQSRFAGVTHS